MQDSYAAIRPACTADSEHIARLAMLAGEGIPAYFWNQIKQANESVVEAGARRVISDETNFSYKNAHVALYAEKIAGLLLGYKIVSVPSHAEVNSAPEFIRPLLLMDRKVPGTYYINMLATYPEYRGKGLGRALMLHAETVAASMNIDALSLQVFNENKHALAFYFRLGYRKVAELPVVPHECHPFTDKVYLLRKDL